MNDYHSPYHIKDTCYHDYPCESYKPASGKYQVIFKDGEIRVSAIVKANTIGAAVFAATTMLQKSKSVDVNALTYLSCVPVA